jgi:hypothetical protein
MLDKTEIIAAADEVRIAILGLEEGVYAPTAFVVTFASGRTMSIFPLK